jgi:mono/diheme cytochrome c family protein
MSSVDLKILGVTLVTIVAYTLVANIIPQVESEVPAEIAFGAEVTPEELVEAGEQLYMGAGGCVACHAETPGARAPNLQTDYGGEGPIGVRCEHRVEGLACKEYLYQALVRPTDHMVGDYPPIMPPVDRTMTQPQIWAMVAYLESLGGEVTVTGADIPDEPAEAGPEGAPPAAGPGLAATAPEEILRELCVQCHTMGDEGNPLGPTFDGIGARRSAEELRLAILDPPAVVTEEYRDFVGLMPVDFGGRMTAEQLETIVRYLSEMR